MRIGETAFILAAGLGSRMRPLSNDRPKPLINVGGQALIDHAIDALRRAGVSRAVVNAHYHADQIDDWASRTKGIDITVSDERARLLDTGGGIKKALPQLGTSPFFVLNSDGFWLDSEVPALTRLRDAWDDNSMDCLLLLCPVEKAIGFDGPGDFHIDGDCRLVRRNTSGLPLYAYIGAYLVHPRLFAGVAEEAFGMNRLWDKAIAQRRLFGLVHDGLWLHVGTPDSVAMAEAHLKNS
jgi:N-acetyl-alpha-D-muramate 1-phosphate uridylyltransferase